DVREEERAARLEPTEQLLDPLFVELRSQPLEDRERSLELGGRRVLVALAPEGEAEQHASLRGLVGRSDALPPVSRCLQTPCGGVGIAVRESDLAPGQVNGRVERRRAL